MGEKMMTFEVNADLGVLEIHLDDEGLAQLIAHLQRLQKAGGHEHLMTPAWGGRELSEERQGATTVLVNSVKIMLWR